MTSKEYLSQIRHIDMSLRTKERELFKLRQDVCCLQSMDFSKDRISGGIPMTFADKVAKLNDIMAELNAEWDKLIALREDARIKIMAMPDATLRTVLIERYINVKRWEQIACEMNYTYRRVIQLHGEALKEFDKAFPIFSLS